MFLINRSYLILFKKSAFCSIEGKMFPNDKGMKINKCKIIDNILMQIEKDEE